jgi:hypothetical protein
MPLRGIDFTSAPSRRKPVTVARGTLERSVLRLERVDALPSLAAFEAFLAEPGPWTGAFDFPFGLPRAFVQAQALGDDAAAVSAELHRRCATRMEFRGLVDAWGNTQAAGQRLLHRQTDRALPGLSSTSPLQTRYVPVGFMYYEGFQRLLDAGVCVPGMVPGPGASVAAAAMAPAQDAAPSPRVALEAYPAALAHELIGGRSYKNSDAPDRLIARKDIVDALEQGRTALGLRCRFSHAQRDDLTADSSGDRLDAVLCLVQAAWASTQTGYGLPAEMDAVEGWILTARPAAPAALDPAPPARKRRG